MSTVTVVATPEPSTGPDDPPRIRLDITDTGTPAVNATTVTRLGPDGRVVPVRTSDGNPLPLTTSDSVRTGLLYDYEAPYGAPVSYSTMETPESSSSSVTLTEGEVWLIHVGVPALSRPVRAAGITGRSRPVMRGVYRPLGSRYAVVQTDGQRKAAEYTLTIRSTTAAERIALDALLDDASVLLLNVPADKRWGIGAEYVSIGDSTEDRLYRYAPEQRRTWDLPITVVDRPVGGSQAERTLLDLLDYPTLDSLQAAYPTLNALLAGP